MPFIDEVTKTTSKDFPRSLTGGGGRGFLDEATTLATGLVSQKTGQLVEEFGARIGINPAVANTGPDGTNSLQSTGRLQTNAETPSARNIAQDYADGDLMGKVRKYWKWLALAAVIGVFFWVQSKRKGK